MEIWFGRTASSSVFFNRKSLLIPVGNITHFSSATDYDDRRGFVQIGETGRDRGGGGGCLPDNEANRQTTVYTRLTSTFWHECFLHHGHKLPNSRLIHKANGVLQQETRKLRPLFVLRGSNS